MATLQRKPCSLIMRDRHKDMVFWNFKTFSVIRPHQCCSWNVLTLWDTSAVPFKTCLFWNRLFACPVLMLQSYFRIIPCYQSLSPPLTDRPVYCLAAELFITSLWCRVKLEVVICSSYLVYLQWRFYCLRLSWNEMEFTFLASACVAGIWVSMFYWIAVFIHCMSAVSEVC